MFSFCEQFDDFLYLGEARMRVKRQKSSIVWNVVVNEELPRHTGILTGNIISFSENPESSESDILEISDGG